MERSSIEDARPRELEPLRAAMSQLVVAHAYDLELDELRSPSRESLKAAFARHVAMYLAHVVFRMSLSAVARGFGRHWSTARHAILKVESLREDPELDRTLGWLEATLRTMADMP